MRVLVTGASGFIGRALLRALSGHQTLGTYRTRPQDGLVHLDLLEGEAVRRRLEGFRPDVVVHCAARPGVDWCEQNAQEARRLNVETTLNLLECCDELGARMGFLSTDYVFDGAAGPYDETARVRPINVYGRLKLETEQALLASKASHLVIRTTNVYGYDPASKNFLMAILSELARSQRVRVSDDQYGTPTHVDGLCEAVRELLVAGAGGVFHVAGPESMSRVEWAQAAAWAFGLDPALIESVPTAELAQPAPRPLRAGLTSCRLGGVVGAQPLGLREGLERMRRDKQLSEIQAW